jgi:hypothetical protein
MALRPRLSRAAAALALALLPAGAARAEAGTPFYGAARLGAYAPYSVELERFGTGFDVQLAVGWWVTPELSVELSAGRGTTSGPAGFEVGGDRVEARLDLYPLALTARWAFPVGNLRPYLLASAGAWIARVRPQEVVPGNGPLSTEWTDGAFGLEGGLGLVYQADERVAFGAEGRWLRARLEHGGKVGLDGLTVLATMEYRL